MDFRFQSLLRNYAAFGDAEDAIRIANETLRMNQVRSVPRLKYSDALPLVEMAVFIEKALEKEGMLDLLDGGLGSMGADRSLPWHALHPNGNLVVYAVRGGSEGHYIHVDLNFVDDGYSRRDVALLGKTFAGMSDAVQIAAFIAEVLENYS
jgi:hypothetical protein